MDFMKVANLIFRYKLFSSEEEEEKTVTALNDVSLTIKQGDFVGILGHNGSGKSTLAKQLAGLLLPTDGCVYINGFDSQKEENNIYIRKSAGIVFQNPDNQLIGNIVEEDIAFGPENLGVPKEEIWNRVGSALEATGMTAYRYKSPRALSGGQKQRIAISGILAMEPQCIILDEPTAMLDPKGRRDVLQAIHHLNKAKNITIILITHHMEEVEEADYLYVMKQGKIMAEGQPAEIWTQTELLKDCGIGLPFERQLVDYLQEEHIDVPSWVISEEDLIHYLVESNANLMNMLGGML